MVSVDSRAYARAADLALAYADERDQAGRGVHPTDVRLFRQLAALVTFESPYMERAFNVLAHLLSYKYDSKTQEEDPEFFAELRKVSPPMVEVEERLWAMACNVVFYPDEDHELVAFSPCESAPVRSEVSLFSGTRQVTQYGWAYVVPVGAVQMLVARLIARDVPLVFEPRIARGIERRRERRVEAMAPTLLNAVPVWTYKERLFLKLPAERSYIDIVKGIPNHEYHSQMKTWSVPLIQAGRLKATLDAAGANTAGFDFVKLPEVEKLPFEVRVLDSQMFLRFKYEDHLVAKLRELPSSRYDGAADAWVMPVVEARALLRALEEFPAYDRSQVEVVAETLPPPPEEAIRPLTKHFLDGARHYQVSGADFLARPLGELRETLGQAFRGFLIADDCGLGKTMQLCEAAWRTCPDDLPIVIVTTKSGRLGWLREIKGWMEVDAKDIWLPRSGKEEMPDRKWMVISIGLLGAYAERLRERGIGVLVVDEAHLFKNMRAERTKLLIGYDTRQVRRNGKLIPAKHVPGVVQAVRGRVLAATGTPIPNRLADTFVYWKLIGHPVGQSFYRFAERYCMPETTSFGTTYNGASNITELRERVSDCFIQRLKADVASELPPKIRVTVPVECPSLGSYKELLAEFKATKPKGASILTFMTDCLTEVALAKAADTIEFVETRLEAGEHVTLYARSKELLDIYENHFKERCVRIDGDKTDKQREEAEVRFQQGEVPLFLGQWTAAGESLNLQIGSHCVFGELPWDPKTYKQVEDRIHRLGQDKLVTISFMVGIDTVDEFVLDNVISKLDVVNTFEQTTDLSTKKLADLFKTFVDTKTTGRLRKPNQAIVGTA